VAETFAQYVTTDAVLINKSTVPVGTAKECMDRIKKIMNKRGVNSTVDVVSNPEFLKE
jgi:UDPglucose 6-dehydrogenase